MKRRLVLCVWAATFVWSISGNASGNLFGHEFLAPPDAGKYAVTDPREADEDFGYQGEYAGSVYDPRCGWIWTGLQVIARGDGKFEAVQFRGGLPGAGWDQQTKRMFAGQRADGVLVLNAEDGWTMVANGRSAAASSSDGRFRGTLTKRHRSSPTLGAAPPRNALVLFDGTSTEAFNGAKLAEDDLLDVGGVTKLPVHDFRMHLEFRLPYMPYAKGQGRANSGVYIQQRYEVQILDSFGLEGVANECGGLYRQQAPDVNMCLPPLVWQTYDIWFTAARFDDAGNKTANARLTLLHNGVAIHNRREIPTKTGAGKPESPEWLPILLQNHSNPVRFRNIWIVLEPEAEKVTPCKPARCRPLRCLLGRVRCRRA